jgi:hypothetical protein
LAIAFTVSAQEINPKLSALLTNYFAIKNELIKGKAEPVSLKAKAFTASVNAIDAAQLTGKEKETFTSLKEKLLLDATHIEKSNDIAHQRDHFKDLSNNFFALAKTIKLSPAPIYQQYCPMEKAYWLSNEKSIKNPYYGNQMLTCGSVTATL